MGLVVAEIVRFTLNGTYLGRPIANVIDMRVGGTGVTDTRSDQIGACANALLDAWASFICPRLSNSYSFTSLTWVDLDSDSGEVGEKSGTANNQLPKAGGRNSPGITGAVAMLVTKQTVSARGERAGRLFIPGLTEDNVDGNIIEPSFLTTMNDDLSQFQEALTETAVLAQWQHAPVVIHTRNQGTPSNPDIVPTGWTTVTAFRANGRVSTQRKRNRR